MAPLKNPTTNNCRRVGTSADEIRDDFSWHLRYTLAKEHKWATDYDFFTALATTVRDRVVDRWLATRRSYHVQNVKRINYLSLEFLIGRLLSNNAINLQMEEECREAMAKVGLDWRKLCEFEDDAGLGNGGLGRLAACFLDSLSTLQIPAVGYGLRYDYGIFRQRIVDGAQVEDPDHWLQHGYPWEIARPEHARTVYFEGTVKSTVVDGRIEWHWVDAKPVIGVPYDVPVIGYGGKAVNALRLWSARSDDEFDFDDFNRGSYVESVQNKVLAENLTKVLYPNDNVLQGKELRLRQQYFFVSCSVQDILRRFKFDNHDWSTLPDKVFIHLNETHPALVIPELMRILVDEEHLKWETAWGLVQRCVGYTNHTILPEALETWSLPLFQRLLPRHTQLIYEINGRFLREVAMRWPGDMDRLQRMSIIDESGEKKMRMANLAIIGGCAVNGVAKLHSQIIKERLFSDFAELWPEKFQNKTNGITQRRWLLAANPGLAALIREKIGDGWITDLTQLEKLEEFKDDGEFMARFRAIKQSNKQVLADYIASSLGIKVDVESIFDVQVKRLHEYKRQLLLALYIVHLFDKLISNPDLDIHPRTFIFAAKAAPGYHMAKLIIQLIHGIADVVNAHPVVGKKVKVVFIPDYSVSLAEKIIPAANVSEQISLAGTEASGTGNMKLMLNGALTLGTLDGANVEIHEAVGDDNIFIFGMRTEEVAERRHLYRSIEIYKSDVEIARVLDLIKLNTFSVLSPGLFDPIVQSLLEYNDHYMLLADLQSYIAAQKSIDQLYRDHQAWDSKALFNVARSGVFSSDRTIREYATEIWDVESCDVVQECM